MGFPNSPTKMGAFMTYMTKHFGSSGQAGNQYSYETAPYDVPPHDDSDEVVGTYKRRRLVSLPKVPGFQEPLYGHHSIQPSETSHAVGYVEADEGTSLGDLATDPAAASVLLGIVLVILGALCPKRFRKGERRQERTSYDDNG